MAHVRILKAVLREELKEHSEPRSLWNAGPRPALSRLHLFIHVPAGIFTRQSHSWSRPVLGMQTPSIPECSCLPDGGHDPHSVPRPPHVHSVCLPAFPLFIPALPLPAPVTEAPSLSLPASPLGRDPQMTWDHGCSHHRAPRCGPDTLMQGGLNECALGRLGDSEG